MYHVAVFVDDALGVITLHSQQVELPENLLEKDRTGQLQPLDITVQRYLSHLGSTLSDELEHFELFYEVHRPHLLLLLLQLPDLGLGGQQPNPLLFLGVNQLAQCKQLPLSLLAFLLEFLKEVIIGPIERSHSF